MFYPKFEYLKPRISLHILNLNFFSKLKKMNFFFKFLLFLGLFSFIKSKCEIVYNFIVSLAIKVIIWIYLGDIVYWKEGKDFFWSMSCDLVGNNIEQSNIGLKECGEKCKQSSECTYFTWTKSRKGSVCSLKAGEISKDKGVYVKIFSVCGIIKKAQKPSTVSSTETSSTKPTTIATTNQQSIDSQCKIIPNLKVFFYQLN